jgi:hypothetical protein
LFGRTVPAEETKEICLEDASFLECEAVPSGKWFRRITVPSTSVVKQLVTTHPTTQYHIQEGSATLVQETQILQNSSSLHSSKKTIRFFAVDSEMRNKLKWQGLS